VLNVPLGKSLLASQLWRTQTMTVDLAARG
jgi:hypothetical protein